MQFHTITKCSGKFGCLVKKMLYIRVRKPTLTVQTDSIRAKVFVQAVYCNFSAYLVLHDDPETSSNKSFLVFYNINTNIQRRSHINSSCFSWLSAICSQKTRAHSLILKYHWFQVICFQNLQEFRVQDLYLKFFTWWIQSCNVHDSSIYLNISFWKSIHLTSFQLHMQLFPICHKKVKGNYLLIFVSSLMLFLCHICTNLTSMIVE